MGFKYCSVNINDYVFSRQCFMTGEYCSKQLSVQRERQRLHNEGKINAFVVMSFTDMTDVVYEWRIKNYIRSLAKNLYFKSTTGFEVTDLPVSFPDFSVLKNPDTEQDTTDVTDDRNNDNRVAAIREFSSYLQAVSEKRRLPAEFKKDSFPLLCCYADEDQHLQKIKKDLREGKYYPEYKVEEINVIRADSNPSSNFVICNRVCQQMQTADLVVVDVSDENTNVFYELGMAMAFQKLILPICYSESYFAMVIPEKVKEEQQERLKRFRKNFAYPKDQDEKKTDENQESKDDQDGYSRHNDIVNRLEYHIDCYPWQRQLFEHFGMRYKKGDKRDNNQKDGNQKDDNQIRYLDYNDVRIKLFGFSDLKYDQFPYRTNIYNPNANGDSCLGEVLYDHLRASFNNAHKEENTLVVYTMDSFLNPDEGWQCIVNYYRAYVRRMQAENCFCGDRIGLLIQSTSIAEPVKDAEERRHLLYNIGEIIQIGMNQATFRAHRQMIKPSEYLAFPKGDQGEAENGKEKSAEVELSEWKDSFRRFTKEYISNRSFPIFPRDPVYVHRVANHVHDDLFCNSIENLCRDPDITREEYMRNDNDLFFCFYHVMLRNLKYVSEIAVDVTHNCVQSLFWLGAAHASGVYAITIRHDSTEQEKQQLVSAGEERGQKFAVNAGRNIFDISGLWTAVLHAYDTKGFYAQLTRVQQGIEQRSKLLLRAADSLEAEIADAFWESASFQPGNRARNERSRDISRSRDNREREVMESYYRNRFWRPMLRRNQLEIFVCQDDLETVDLTKEKSGFARSYVPAWDVEAISAFSHYLSKRKMIGEYEFSLEPRVGSNSSSERKKTAQKNLEKKNYICVGAHVNPYTDCMMSEYLNKCLSCNPNFCELKEDSGVTCKKGKTIKMRGFFNSTDFRLVAEFPDVTCKECWKNTEKSVTIDTVPCPFSEGSCEITDKEVPHSQFGQLLLWREEPKVDVASGMQNTEKDNEIIRESYSFRASLIGTSGPATSALSTLFVDEKQKEDVLSDYKKQYDTWRCEEYDDCPIIQKDKDRDCPLEYNEKESCPLLNDELTDPLLAMLFPLSSLQEEIRGILLARYHSCLHDELKGIEAYSWKRQPDSNEIESEKNDYIIRVITASELYLSTVLYRRFFPFLSHEDESRICNGLSLFIYKVMSQSISPFALAYEDKNSTKKKRLEYSDFSAIILNKQVEDAAKRAVETLKKLLDSLQAVEVFYKIPVVFEPDKERNITARKARIIELIKRGEFNESPTMHNGNEESKDYLIRCVFKE